MSALLLHKIGSKEDPEATDLASRTRGWISNQRRKPTSPQLMRGFPAAIKDKCPSAELRSLSDAYNCFGLAFGSRRTHIEDDIDRVLVEDCYKRIAESEVLPFDLVIYRKQPNSVALHVGVVWTVESPIFGVTGAKKMIKVLSQWGRGGEYFHNVDHVDQEQHGAHREYWTDRVSR